MLQKFRPLNVKRQNYEIASKNDEAEITLYGTIVETPPIDFWTGEPIPGNYITQTQFLEDLKAIENAPKIRLRIHSLGGDADVSILIHNRLRELADKGTQLSCVVDGVAMSGGSLIMCACDDVQVNPSSLVMIHKCWLTLFGSFNADELRKAAESNDAYDKAQAAIYSRKSKLTETVVLHMMSNTTYLVGKEAVEKGFADGLKEDEKPLQIAADASRSKLYINGRAFRLPYGKIAPDFLQTLPASNEDQNTESAQADTPPEGGETMATNLEELRAENAQLAATIEDELRAAATAENAEAVNRAVAAERQRLADIDEIASLYDNALVNEAKYGSDACTAQELSFRAARDAVRTGARFMTQLEADNHASGANAVGAAPEPQTPEPETPEEKMNAARAKISAVLHKTKVKKEEA